MFSTAKWAAASAGVLAVVGGLVLAAGGGDPPAPRTAARTPVVRLAPVPENREPAWMTAFRREYALADGQYVKRVGPPYSEDRKEYMYRAWNKKKLTPEEEARTRDILDRQKMFLDFDGRELSRRTALSAVHLQKIPEFEQAGKMMNVWTAVTYVTGRESPDVVIDPKSKDHPLLSVEERIVGSSLVRGNPSVVGDFVTRKDAPLDKLAPQLEAILRNECGLDVWLTLKREEHPVFVVAGTFKPNPPAWRPKKELDVYTTEEGLNKEYDHFDPNGNARREKFKTVRSAQHSGTPVDLVRAVGSRLGTRMMWDAPLPAAPRVSWISHTVRNPTKEQAAADRGPEKVLAVVSAQTGLTFKKETRAVEVLYLSAPEPK